jgi:hypothetical protein
MTDAPEKIWHTIDRQGKISSSPDAHVEPCLEVSSSYIEYTRSDIPQARIAELETRNGKLGDAVAYATQKFTHQEARISQLEGALGSLQGWAQSKPRPAGETPREYHMHAIICEALTALKSKP